MPSDDGAGNRRQKDNGKNKRENKDFQGKKNSIKRWTITIIILTFFLSMVLSTISNSILANAGLIIAIITVLFFILLGIIFDIIGIAVAAATETSFHSMRSKKIKGAAEAVKLIRNAEKVSNFCNDVIGDISGIVSGSAVATIVLHLENSIGDSNELLTVLLGIIVTAVVAALTVGGKALGKSVAINKSNEIIFAAGRIIHFFNVLKLNKHKGMVK